MGIGNYIPGRFNIEEPNAPMQWSLGKNLSGTLDFGQSRSRQLLLNRPKVGVLGRLYADFQGES